MLFCHARIFIIAKKQKIFIIINAFGVSSNGRTRDFGSLYHGSNPCAPTKNQTGFVPVLFLVRGHGATPATQLRVRQQVDLISRGAIKSLRLPRRRRAFMRDTEGTRAPRTDCTNGLRICTAKHYQCFVSVSENSQFSKTQVRNIPTPLCAPHPPFASATLRAASPICFCVNKLFL